MAFSHGSAAALKIDNSGGSLTDVSAYVSSYTFSPVADTGETTALGATTKAYIAGLKDATLSLEGPWDPTMDAILNSALGSSSTKSYEVHPQGTGSGLIKYTGEAICTSYTTDVGVDGVLRYSAEFQCTGTITRGTN